MTLFLDNLENIFSILYINIILTSIEGTPEYPENVTIKDLTGDRANFAGVYKRQGGSRVWRYGEFELSFNGKVNTEIDIARIIIFIFRFTLVHLWRQAQLITCQWMGFC